MNPMVCQLLKTFHVGSKCCVPVLLWSLAAWVLLLHAYTSLLRVPSQLPEPQSRWQMTSPLINHDADKQSAQKMEVEMIEMVDGIAQMEVEKVGNWNKLEENVDLEETFGAAALAKPMTTAKAPEESKEALARRKLALLFPDKRSAIDPSKVNGSEYGYFYPGQEWLDSAGRPIQAHGGGVMYVAETHTYYWYGENKDGATKYSPKQGTARREKDQSKTPLWKKKECAFIDLGAFHISTLLTSIRDVLTTSQQYEQYYQNSQNSQCL